MATNSIHWLHLSDFHTGKDEFGQTGLFKYICDFVAEKVNSGEAPDYVFITGDVANTGQTAEYEKFVVGFLSPLSRLLGKNWEKKLYVVPGNHDCDWRQAFVVDWHTVLDRFPNYLNPTDEALSQRQDLLRRFKGFADCDCSHLGGKWLLTSKGVFSEIIDQSSVKIGILGINTAWLSQGNDEGKLTPGKGMVELGLDAIKECDIRIVLGHHSIDWFRKDNQRQIQSLFGKNHVIYLHGDLHENEMGLRLGGGYLFLDFQAAAAFQERESTEYVNGFQWCELDIESKELSVLPFIWSSKNQEWGIDGIAFPERFRKNGTDRWAFPLPDSAEAKEVYLQIKPPDKLDPPSGWWWIDKAFLERNTRDLTKEQAIRFFDGMVPGWEEALSPLIPRRDIVHKVAADLIQARQRHELRVDVLYGPSGEGKSTSLRQIIAELLTSGSEWRILWRTDMETTTPIDFLLKLPPIQGTWLITSDEAHEIADSVCDAVKALHLAGRTDIQFLLSSRDTDWIGANADDLPWPDRISPHLEPIKGLTIEDAEKIVRTWNKFGSEGMGRLASLDLTNASVALANAAEEERLKDPAEGSFLGAMLRVRKGDDIKSHVDSLLFRLSRRDISSEKRLIPRGTLLDAFAYIAIIHADDIISLPKVVLAEVLNLDQRQLNRLVIGPLGDEAAATLAGNFVITRHRSIAQAAISILSSKYHIYSDEIYSDLVRAAWDATSKGNTVINRLEWLHLSRKLYDMGQEALGLELAHDLYDKDKTNTYLVVTYASLLRDSGNADQSVNILRSAYKGLKKDRAFYFEWSMTEGKLGRVCLSVWLAGISLADETEGALDLKTAKMRLVALTNTFEDLYLKHNAQVFIEAIGAVAQLGLRITALGDRESATLRRGSEASQKAGVNEMDIVTAISRLHSGIIAGWQRKENNLPLWVKNADDLTFDQLKRLFTDANITLGLRKED